MGKTYEYTGINNSATIQVKAVGDLGEAGARAVKLSARGINFPAAGEIPTGIILISEDEAIKEGDDITIQVKDIGLWKTGAAVEVGELLAVDADGLCQKATAGQYIFATALDQATQKGDLISIQIIHAGYQK